MSVPGGPVSTPGQGQGRILAGSRAWQKGIEDTYTSNEFNQLRRPLTMCVYIQIHR